MIRPPTPGAYLKQRRTAALLSVADVALAIPTDPATPEHLRIEQLELIEADIQPMTLATIAALRGVFRFEVEVLLQLEQIAQGSDMLPPRLCRICGWGTAYDNLSWPIMGLCRSCYEAQPPEAIAALIDKHAASPRVAVIADPHHTEELSR